jgi:hypothetical protein
MLSNTAAWVQEECARFSLPITYLTAAQAQDGHSRGVTQHSQLGAWGGGHWDAGPGFPIEYVLSLARGEIPTTGDDKDMDARIATNPNNGGKALLDLATGEYKGLSKEMYDYFNAQGVKAVTGLTPSQWSKLKQTGTL